MRRTIAGGAGGGGVEGCNGGAAADEQGGAAAGTGGGADAARGQEQGGLLRCGPRAAQQVQALQGAGMERW